MFVAKVTTGRIGSVVVSVAEGAIVYEVVMEEWEIKLDDQGTGLTMARGMGFIVPFLIYNPTGYLIKLAA